MSSPVPTSNPVAPAKRRGRPRTPGKHYSSEAERKRVERAEELRKQWIDELRHEQAADERALALPGFLKYAPQGRGRTVSGFGTKRNSREQNQQFEHIIGAANRTGLLASFQGFTEVLDAYNDLGELKKQIDQHLANQNLNPDVRKILENSDVEEVRSILTETTYTGNTGGSTGDRVNTSAPSIDEHDIHIRPGSASILCGRYSDRERIVIFQIDECLRRLRDDPRFCIWSEELNEQDQPVGYVCQLCQMPLGVIGAYAVASHFLHKHQKETRKFFRAHKVRFMRRYLLN